MSQPFGETPSPPPPPPPWPGAPYGAPTRHPAMGVAPPNYLVWAILSTCFCFWPFGVVSIIFAAQVDSKFARGDYQGAHEASEKAKGWARAATIVGIVIVVLVTLVLLTAVGAHVSNQESQNVIFNNLTSGLNP